MGKIPETRKPRALAVGGFHACVLDDERVKCWGQNDMGQASAPQLKNPRALIAGRVHSCALDDDGIKCWGDNADGQTDDPGITFGPSLKEPSFKIFQLESSLQVLIEGSLPTRSMFFKKILAFVNENQKTSKNSSSLEQFSAGLSQYIVLSLLGPAIQSGDSDYYLQKVLPSYQENMIKASKELGVTNLNEIYYDSPLNRRAVFAVIQSSIAVAVEFLPMNQRQPMAEVNKLLGLAMANANRQNTLAVLDAIQRNRTILEKLKASTKTAFLSETIEVATEWLNNQVR